MTTEGSGANRPAPTCATCGAPDGGDFVMCRFCRQPVSAEAQRTAIPCPNGQCRTPCRWGKQRCVACQAWLVVSCAFCGSLSPHNLSNCLQCNEAFAGAQQRIQHRKMEQHQRHSNQQSAVWGNVAASVLGGVGGAVLGGVITSALDDDDSGDDLDVGDIGDVSDDTGFDFGGDE